MQSSQRNAKLLTPHATQVVGHHIDICVISWAMLALICRMMFFSSALMQGALFADRFRDDGFQLISVFSTTIQPIPHAPRLNRPCRADSGAIAHSLRMELAVVCCCHNRGDG